MPCKLTIPLVPAQAYTAAISATGSAACRMWVATNLQKKFKKYPIGYVHIDIAEVILPKS